jgi:hypothetical protein
VLHASLSPAGLAASHDGSLCVSISRDRSVKVYDVLGFDMIMMMKLPYTPGTAEWIFKVRGSWCEVYCKVHGVKCTVYFSLISWHVLCVPGDGI